MPKFTYTARDRGGAVQTGNLEAVGEDEVVSILQHRGLYLVSLIKSGVSASGKSVSVQRHKSRRLHTGIRMEDQVLLCQQLAVLVEAGVPLLKSLEVVSAQIQSRRLMAVLDQVRSDVESGRTFRDSLAKHPAVFSTLWLSMVETGEASGHLAEALQQLATHFEKAKKLRSEVETALTYPAFLIGASALVLIFFAYVIIPKFEVIFKAMSIELPPLTLAVLAVSHGAKKYGILIIIVLALGGFLIGKYLRTVPGQWMRDRIVLKLPLMGTLMGYAQVAEFTQGLGTLLASGVPLLSCLEILAKSCSNRVYGQAIGEVCDGVKEGRSLAEPMAKSALFPPMMVQMILVGEEVGELAKMVMRVARYYENLTETFIARMTKLFEPIAIVVMGGLVMIIVLSIFMPIFKIATDAKIN